MFGDRASLTLGVPPSTPSVSPALAPSDLPAPVRLGQLGALPRPTYFFTQLGIYPKYLQLIVWPAGLNIDHDAGVFTTILATRPMLGVIIVAGWVGLMWILWKYGRTIGLFGAGLVVITMALESSVFPLAEIMAEYRLYLPMAGIALLAGDLLMWLIDRLSPIWQKALLGAVAGLVLGLGVTSFQRNEVWRDPLLLWQDAAAKSPNKARPFNNLGTIYLTEIKDYPAAIENFERALEIQPEMGEALVNLGTAQTKLGKTSEAIANYKRAIELFPNRVAPKANLGKIYFLNNRLEEAKVSFEDAIATDPWFIESYNGLGAVYVKLGDLDLAREQFEQALELQPGYESAQNNLKTIELLEQEKRRLPALE